MIKHIYILLLSSLLFSCFLIDDERSCEIDIGNFEYERNAWNEQNILDYQIVLEFYSYSSGKRDFIFNIKNGILESYEPSDWSEGIFPATIHDIYSDIEFSLDYLKKEYKKGNKDVVKILVSYDEEYHYPKKIECSGWSWTKTLGAGDGYKRNSEIKVIFN